MIKLEEIGVFKTGGTPSRKHPEYYGNVYPWVTSTALTKSNISTDDAVDWLSEEGLQKSSTKIIKPNSLMIGVRVGIGNCSINDVPMCTSQDVISIEDIDITRYYLPFLRLFIKSKHSYFERQKRGVTIKGISSKILKNLIIPNCSYQEQVHIAKQLEYCNEILERRISEIKLLDNLQKARFVEMFGNIGQDNKGWRLTTLGKACIINPHRSKDINTNLEYSFVPMPSVSEHGSIDASECKQYDEVKNGYTYFQENDVLFAKITPCMENGKGAVAQGLKNGIGFGSTEFHILRPIDGISNPYWLYEITMQPQFRIFAERHMTGSGGQRRVPASFLKNFPISIPPLDLQNHYADFFQQVDKSKAAIQKSIDETQLLYDSLMQKYFG